MIVARISGIAPHKIAGTRDSVLDETVTFCRGAPVIYFRVPFPQCVDDDCWPLQDQRLPGRLAMTFRLEARYKNGPNREKNDGTLYLAQDLY